MPTIHFDSAANDDMRRHLLYNGDIFVYTPSDAGVQFCAFARSLIEDAFGDLAPDTAQHQLPVDDYVRILSRLKPAFIHHDESKRHLRALLTGIGCNPNDTYFDVPRLRSSTSDGYLTAGIAYAWHPHRDTWFSAPSCQINWWLPIYPIQPGNTIAFYPALFNSHVANDSHRYNYYEWNQRYRSLASKQVTVDNRPLPRPTGRIEESNSISIVCPVGGMIAFSGAQLHASVPNYTGKTRFSIDFRTVNCSDISAGLHAPTMDVACSGSSIRDFRRLCDGLDLPADIVDVYRDGTEMNGELRYSERSVSTQ